MLEADALRAYAVQVDDFEADWFTSNQLQGGAIDKANPNKAA
ncbi:hypothetical protein [Salinivibrio costicola]|nr:hypothetical protein [Salinivibrio costicola]